MLPDDPDDSPVDDSSAGEERAEAGDAPWENYDLGASQKILLIMLHRRKIYLRARRGAKPGTNLLKEIMQTRY